MSELLDFCNGIVFVIIGLYVALRINMLFGWPINRERPTPVEKEWK